MLAIWLLAAHTQSLSREILIQSRAAGNASILFEFALSTGTAASFLRVQADLNHDGVVSAAEADATLSGWLAVAFADVTLTGSACHSQRAANDLLGPVRNEPMRIAVLWECEPAEHFTLFVGDKMETRVSFLPASVSAVAVCHDCAEQRHAAREAEWFYLPGAFFLSQ
jgi:hypothetical protein